MNTPSFQDSSKSITIIVDTNIASDRLRGFEHRLAFADRDDLFVAGKGEQFAESPDTTEIEWSIAMTPAFFEIT